jgi:glyoxylase-like metal-dependent hydrolase (beta-lactamase superfamily II)
VDTGFQRPNFDAAYLIVDNGHAAFIDTGTGHAVPRLLASLSAIGLAPAQVDWVIPTHVHLDHAGGVGRLMQQLPHATLLVHPRGLRHLLDPSALYQGALAVYGQAEMDRSYGQLVGVPAERAQASSDGQTLTLGQRTLTLIDTPGHARHHHCIWDPVSRGWFTGDSFGLSYRELDTDGQPWILPTTTPVQFEPDAARTTVRRLMAVQPERVYLTHYGALSPVAPLASALLRLLDEVETLGQALRQHPDRHAALSAALLALYERDLRAAGNTLPPARVAELLALDVELNAQGMACWLDKLPA